MAWFVTVNHRQAGQPAGCSCWGGEGRGRRTSEEVHTTLLPSSQHPCARGQSRHCSAPTGAKCPPLHADSRPPANSQGYPPTLSPGWSSCREECQWCSVALRWCGPLCAPPYNNPMAMGCLLAIGWFCSASNQGSSPRQTWRVCRCHLGTAQHLSSICLVGMEHGEVPPGEAAPTARHSRRELGFEGNPCPGGAALR